MGKAPWMLLLVVSVQLLIVYGEKENNNNNNNINDSKSGLGGITWATGKDESDLLAEQSIEIENEGDEFAGGFSSLDGMLQWAIGHSDPEKLKERAEDVQKLSPEELEKRQLEIKELMERLKTPSDAELMKIAIRDLNNSSITKEDRLRALNELLILVEPIDNANDLDKMGGVVAVIRELENSESEIRTISAWILGKASQNNALVQNQILNYGAMKRLIEMVNSSCTEEAVKSLYAISSLIRNNLIGQQLFYFESGNSLLRDLLTSTSVDTRLKKKVVFLVSDLADYHINNNNNNNYNNNLNTFLSDRLFLKSVVDLLAIPDLDLQEKVLMAIRSLLGFETTEAVDLKEFCGFDIVLERMRIALENLIISGSKDDQSVEYATEIESLRREVQTTFHNKLDQETRTQR